MRKPTCAVPDCGRPVKAAGQCRTHRKQFLKTGRVWPIRPPSRKGVVAVAGRYFTADCAITLTEYAQEHGITAHAAMTDVLEAWARRKKRRDSRKPRK
jgi:hypothetical protein